MILPKMKLLLLASAALLAGCVSVPKEAGFASVQDAVTQRTGQRIQWNRGTSADRQVVQAVHDLLQRPLNADAAVQVALLNNQSLQATYEELGIAQAELVEAGLLHNPTLSAEVRFPSRPALPYEIDVMQDFLDLLSLPLRKRAAGAAFEAAKLRVTNEVLKTAADVKAAFYRAQGSAQLADLRRGIVEATSASYDAATRLHEAGNINDLALAEQQALYEQAKIELAKAERDALDAREELNALMGAWGDDTQWTLVPRLPELPPEDIDLHHLESLAVAQRTDLGAARQEAVATAQRLGLTRSTALFGQISAGAHVEKDTDGALTIGPAIQLPLPIFNQGQPAIAAAEARLRQSERRYAALAIEIRAQVRRARNRMIAARHLAQYYARVVVPLRHQIVEQNQLQYNAMQTGVFQLIQTRQAEIDAGREYIEALQGYWVARAELERAVGGRFATTAPATAASEATTQPAPQNQHQHHHGE